MPRYEVHGTDEASPTDDDWYPLAQTDDPVEATALVHQTEGTFWRRLTEDGQVVLPRV
ncbi:MULTISPECIES: hypothetical protein [Streptomyces]|uniref:hypothetical protein n=1 Tax=Streptomyces TaxID=1883 RepID=UPI000ACFA09D|nr:MULTISPECIES: hypothetical protein [Streptomyces]